ncbi:hypothetical protein OG809_34010 [Kribbella soli]
MLPLTAASATAVRLVVSAVPITLLIALFALVMLISLALPKERRDYVLELAPVVVQLVKVMAAPRASR